MAYIVPDEMPTSCVRCPFGHCKFSYPLGYLIGQNKPIKGYYCSLDKEQPKRVLVTPFSDNESKAEWCPLKKVGEG